VSRSIGRQTIADMWSKVSTGRKRVSFEVRPDYRLIVAEMSRVT
jgi:hypothetical protein